SRIISRKLTEATDQTTLEEEVMCCLPFQLQNRIQAKGEQGLPKEHGREMRVALKAQSRLVRIESGLECPPGSREGSRMKRAPWPRLPQFLRRRSHSVSCLRV